MKLARKRTSSMALCATFLALSGCGSPDLPHGRQDSGRVELGQDENLKEFGKYTVHVNALTTSQLSADVAKSYNISRSTNRAILNVVITKKENGAGKPTGGTVSSVARNLAGQYRDLTMRKIVEQDAIYFIGELAVENLETIIFEITVAPSGETEPFSLIYRHQFFTE